MSVKEFIELLQTAASNLPGVEFDPITIPIPRPFPAGFAIQIQYSYTGNISLGHYFNVWLVNTHHRVKTPYVLEYLNIPGVHTVDFVDVLEKCMDELNCFWTNPDIRKAWDFLQAVPTKNGKITQNFLHWPAGTTEAEVRSWFMDAYPGGITALQKERTIFRKEIFIGKQQAAELQKMMSVSHLDYGANHICKYEMLLNREIAFDQHSSAALRVQSAEDGTPLWSDAQLLLDGEVICEGDNHDTLLGEYELEDDLGNTYILQVNMVEETIESKIRTMPRKELATLLYHINHRPQFLNLNDVMEFLSSPYKEEK